MTATAQLPTFSSIDKLPENSRGLGMKAKQIEAVVALDASRRVEHFAKAVADREEAWGLYADEWAASATDTGETAFPLWPASEYAALCATGDWSTYVPRSIALVELTDALLPMLREQRSLAAVFQTPSGRGVTVTPDELLAMLAREIERF